MKKYELIIVGGGPAGLTAGIYASRARLKTLLIEKAFWGGQIINADLVENYPGFPEGISGFDLGQLIYQQAMKFGLETLTDEVRDADLDSILKKIHTSDDTYQTKALIIAGGSEHKKLSVPGEERLLGKGVSYCATCDGALFRDQRVAVLGGGDAAITEALFLSRFASKVIVIHRRDQLRASKIVQEKAFSNPKVEFLWDTVVDEIMGDKAVTALSLSNLKSKAISILEVSGVFIYLGFLPNSNYLKNKLELDDTGHIIVNKLMETKIPGVFAAGDVCHNSSRQVITAAGDGATAALSAERFINGV